MNRGGYRWIRLGRTVRQDLFEAVGGKLAENRIELAISIHTSRRRCISQGFVHNINPIMTKSPSDRYQRHRQIAPPCENIDLRMFTTCAERIAGKFVVWSDLLVIGDAGIAEGLQYRDDQRAKGMADEIVRLKFCYSRLTPVLADHAAKPLRWCGQFPCQISG